MRYNIAALGVVALAVAIGHEGMSDDAKAQGPCECAVQFANMYTTLGSVHDKATSVMRKRGVPVTGRRKISQGVYDWNRRKDFKSAFCRRNARACRAAAACIGAGAAAIVNNSPEETFGHMIKRAAVACGAAASAVWLAG